MFGQTYNSRISNSKRNIASGFLKQFFTMVFGFIIRTLVLYRFGEEYQGLSGLFTSILQVLNLSELGFSTAITFILYKPIADNNIDDICSILNFLKKVYKAIGLIILIVGIAIMPFIKFFINGTYPDEINIYFLYSIYLFNAVVSYLLFAYKSTLLTAAQRLDLVSNAYTITYLCGKIAQICILLLSNNYYAFVLIIPIVSIMNNIVVEFASRKAFPNLKAKGLINDSIKKNVIKQVKAVFINRIGDIARNSFDNIVLSAMVGLVAVTAYGNYYFIYAALYGVMGIIAHSVRAGVGNSIVKESPQKNYNDLLKFSFIYMWIVSWCTVCMFVLYQPFMIIWMKNKTNLILSDFNMSLFCLYFYCISMAYTTNIYLEAKGLFYECRYLYICEAIGNLILNIVLCWLWGISGILIATIITIFIFDFFGRSIVLFRYYFSHGAKQFAMNHLFYFFVTCINCFLTKTILNLFTFDMAFWEFLTGAIICVIFSNSIFILFYFKNTQFSYLKSLIIKNHR